MTRAKTEKLLGQLRVLHRLTVSESQVAQSRQVLARNDGVRQQFRANAANAQQRTQLIAAALRELGGVPDVITPVLGRATALVKTVVEQAQPLTGALFADLALEHQLLDRARYLEVLADAAGHIDTRLLAQRLQCAHRDTVEWITSVLAEEACEKPAPVPPTPVRKALGWLTSAAKYPSRWAATRINEAARAAFTGGHDGELHQAELTIHPDNLTANEVEQTVAKQIDTAPLDVLLRYVFSDPAAMDALLRYTRNDRDCAGGSSGSGDQLAEVRTRASNGS